MLKKTNAWIGDIMALVPCKECKQLISSRARICPYCGKRKTSLVTKMFAWLFGIVVLVTITSHFIDVDPPEPPPAKKIIKWETRDDSGYAFAWAQSELKKHLKAPSTAKFPGILESSGHVVALPGQRYLVRSWVDSQNVFGAMIRTHYSASMVQKEKGVWEVVEIQLK